MKKNYFLLIIFLLFISKIIYANPGDTTFVKTFDFNWPKPSGLNPMNGKFVFPSFQNKTFEKVLMYYKLKCDPSQNPQCGEWDYLSYSNLFEHTGKLDSTQYTHQKYIFYNYSGTVQSSFLIRNTQSWNYSPYFQKYLVHDSIISYDTTLVGNLTTSISQPFFNGNSDGRSVFIWKASELLNSGFTAGDISGFNLYIDGLNTPKFIGRLVIKIKQSNVDSLIIPTSLDSLTLVYDKNTIIQSNGKTNFQFNQNFIWDGISNLIIDFEYLQENTGINVKVNNYASICGITTVEPDNYVTFGLNNFIEIPTSRFSQIDSSISLIFWQFGDIGLPFNGSVFEGINASNTRLLNVHLPWSNSNVYWDAGNGDRINKTAQASEFKGKWNHWAFTKSCETGKMRIYLNGNLWFDGSGKTKLMNSISRFILGQALTYQNGVYKGSIDDFSIWKKELSIGSIQQLMYNKLTTSNPEFQNLIYAYNFNETNGISVKNIIDSTQHAANFTGIVNRNSYKGNRIKNFVQLTYKPVIVFEKGVYQSHIDSLFVIDSAKSLPIMVVVYNDSLHPTTATDTIYKYLPYNRYTYTPNGIVTDSVLFAAEDTLFQKTYIYYGTPFEVINRWELGRFITPYGNGLSLGDGWTWIYDVTDFVKLLKDTVYLQGGNFQELLDMQFAFIEGTPSRNVINIKNIWQGNYNLNNFDAIVTAKTIAIDTATEKMVKLRTTVTGHGMGGANNCAEFCSNVHKLKVNGQLHKQWQIIQPCALNPLYPQGGTWVYARAAWCPGMPATKQEFQLDSFVVNNQITIDYDIDQDSGGNYVTESQLVTYSNPNFLNDASLVEIISPNKNEMFTRFNPICGKPMIRIKNTGKNALSSLSIDYGFTNGPTNTYQWTGNLAFLETAEVTLPAINWSYASGTTEQFWAEVKTPNSVQDEYSYNNKLTTSFNTVPKHSESLFQMYFMTNSDPGETSWKLEDINNNIIIKSDTGMSANTVYIKGFFLANGCYKITITDLGDDGLKFWANMPPNGNGTAGLAILKKNVGPGFVPAYNFNGDFGREVSYSFIVNDLSGIKDNEVQNFMIFPNPANELLNINTKNLQFNNIEMKIYNIFGANVKNKFINVMANENIEINISDLTKGFYWIQFWENGKVVSRNHFVKM